ncbi:MAG TPA: glycosyltransferase family 1 protein [Gammaproteobacteria bacterium]|nr:glycosyltransferase family 1 protein [Gammaproteobacteria bacterium]
MAVYYLCPDSDHPTGGIRVIYRHVDVLNTHGIEAYVLHQRRGFRCTWFENQTPVAYTRFPIGSLLARVTKKLREKFSPASVQMIPIVGGARAGIGVDDVLVLTETCGPDLAAVGRGIPRVILNQNGFLTFKGYSFDKDKRKNPYSDPSVLAVLVNSEHCEEYVRYAFPDVNVCRFFLSVDPALFYFQRAKKKQICLSRVKSESDAMQVINILKHRDVLEEFDVVPFVNIPQQRVAELMRESLIFLSFGYREGFGLPAAEAMACGCIVIGYHGWGGREFFNPDWSFPIEDGDIIGFSSQVEQVIKRCNADSQYFSAQREQAARFVASQYSLEKEERALVEIWNAILAPR